MSAFATSGRRCSSTVTIGAALIVRVVRAGPDIAKPVAEIAGLVGKWIADELLFDFFSRISFCKQGP
ncbi:hypothetical protein ACH79_03925 [Bradyrhizobium sp. CCBAU 051011]|nr:hypothetical protein ACH79_03925 [Bradyrhizobium sp. CCBAU 051011]